MMNLYRLALVLATLAVGCGGTVATGGGGAPSTCAPDLAACPAGSYDTCQNAETLVSCCDGQTVTSVCATPMGILTHTCPATSDGGTCSQCAVREDTGATTCCDGAPGCGQ